MKFKLKSQAKKVPYFPSRCLSGTCAVSVCFRESAWPAFSLCLQKWSTLFICLLPALFAFRAPTMGLGADVTACICQKQEHPPHRLVSHSDANEGKGGLVVGLWVEGNAEQLLNDIKGHSYKGEVHKKC